MYVLLQHQVRMTSICQSAKKLQRQHLFCSGSSTTNNWHKEHNIVSVRAEQWEVTWSSLRQTENQEQKMLFSLKHTTFFLSYQYNKSFSILRRSPEGIQTSQADAKYFIATFSFSICSIQWTYSTLPVLHHSQWNVISRQMGEQKGGRRIDDLCARQVCVPLGERNTKCSICMLLFVLKQKLQGVT